MNENEDVHPTKCWEKFRTLVLGRFTPGPLMLGFPILDASFLDLSCMDLSFMDLSFSDLSSLDTSHYRTSHYWTAHSWNSFLELSLFELILKTHFWSCHSGVVILELIHGTVYHPEDPAKEVIEPHNSRAREHIKKAT